MIRFWLLVDDIRDEIHLWWSDVKERAKESASFAAFMLGIFLLIAGLCSVNFLACH